MNRNLKTMIGLGLVGGIASVAAAQPYLINLTGATLLDAPLSGNAITNDFFGADPDGNSTMQNGVVDNLNPAATPSNIGANDWWVIQYRQVGSVSGFQELVSFADAMVTDGHQGMIPGEGFTSRALFNRTRFINNTARVTSGGGAGLYNEGNPGGSPARSDASYVAQFATPPTPSAGFWQADIAPVDVPALWAVQSIVSGPASFDKAPGQIGYGRNPRTSTNKDGSPNAWNYLLVNLGNRNLNETNPNPGQTIYSTQLAYAPVAVLTNLGTGIQTLKSSELRHLYVTGRLPTGENLVAVTREIGSGTHNSIMNSLCMDPSFGVGEAVGGLGVGVPVDNRILGPDFNPGNMLGSGEMETTMQNVRLGIGYTGAERGFSSGWLSGGRLEVLGVENDLAGGSTPVRPTMNAILFNSDPDSSYRIGGIATLNTLGDPKASSAAFGGENNGHPKLLNEHAAAFVNNITLSIADFNFTGGTPFTPAEDLANRGIFLTAAPDFLPLNTTHCVYQANPVAPATKARVQDFYINVSTNPLKQAAYASFGTVTLNGIAPTRRQGVVYSDGVANGSNYIIQDSGLTLPSQANPGQIAYASNLNDRNRIAGDFNGDAARNADDIEEMMKALEDRAGGSAWTAPDGNATLNNAAGGGACIEILGDFNGDGNFDAQDVRYFADGLAIDANTGKLDRKLGFTRVDQFYLGMGDNPFGTTLANPLATYSDGDARGDVAGGIGQTPNFQPIGWDGVVDAADIDYVYANFLADWADTYDAVGKDLSCDINGDLVVDQADVCELVRDILETEFGDADLDGDVDAADIAIVDASIATPPAVASWSNGDFNGDGVVDNTDKAIVLGLFDPCAGRCPADLSGASDPNDPSYGVPDGDADADDFFYYLDQFVSGNLAVADLTGSSDPNDPTYGSPDGLVDASDFFYYLDLFVAGCP